MQDFLITIAEGSRQLGISERRLRQTLREPELQVQLRKTNRAVGGRERSVLMIPNELLGSLQVRFAAKQKVHKPQPVAPEANIGQQTGITFTGASLVAVYQRLVAEKSLVVEQQEERIADLQRATAHERDRSKRTQLQALSRYSTDNSGKDVMIATSLASELRRLFSEDTNSADGTNTQARVTAAEGLPASGDPDDLIDIEAPPASLVRIYELILLEKDRLIKQQQGRIADLQVGLEHERDQTSRTNLLFDVSEPQTRKLLPNSKQPDAPPRPFWASWFSSGK